MNITDYLRMYLGQFMSIGIFLLTVFAGAHFLQRQMEANECLIIRKLRNWIVVCAAGTFACYLFTSSVTNTVPRGVVNRSAVDAQQLRYEQSLRK